MSLFMKQVSAQIRSIRTKKGLSQTMLGKKAGFNYRYIGFIEQGRVNARVKTLERIAHALDMELCDLCAPLSRHLPAIKETPKDRAIFRIVNLLKKQRLKDIKTVEKIIKLLD